MGVKMVKSELQNRWISIYEVETISAPCHAEVVQAVRRYLPSGRPLWLCF